MENAEVEKIRYLLALGWLAGCLSRYANCKMKIFSKSFIVESVHHAEINAVKKGQVFAMSKLLNVF